jgi:transglutaminase/protease-like cytokinesis protein 3
MMDYPVIYAVEELYETAEGDEGIDGLPIEQPTNWDVANLQLVDKSARFINSLPPMMSAASLAQGYVCRPYRSDVQRLRSIFTWVGEKVAWDDDLEGDVDPRRVILLKRGCPQEVAALVMEMCSAVGLQAEVVQGYLKSPGEFVETDCLSRPNHWWNTVLIDGEWRIMDCSLASPTHPKRSLYSCANPQAADTFYFLTRPMEICYTHIPLHAEHQHICPPISPDVLLALPAACPAFFKHGLQIPHYDTSLIRINGLETVQIRIYVPADVECVAEVEAVAFARDSDGDRYESGDVIRKRALSQADWIQGQKRFTVKGLLPGDEGQGILKVYAGKKGLMHSSRDNPHPLAFALPIIHTGENPPYEFLTRHPTPHAQRHDLYVIQPQCGRLAINNTFVFAVRQHPAMPQTATSSFNDSETSGRISPNPFARPSSALSMVSSVAAFSTTSGASSTPSLVNPKPSSGSREKPAKLAVQTPSGKILRLTRKADHMVTTSTSPDAEHGTPDGSVWETVIKVSERGVWRGLVLADRSARWCVWGEWECY